MPREVRHCYAGCAHHDAPAGLQAIVPLWGTDTVRLTEASAGRYEGVMSIFLNGTKLTNVVRDGLPAGVTAALEFSVSGSGAIRQ